MIRFACIVLVVAFLAWQTALSLAQQPPASSIPLPTSKTLTIPTPGRIGSTNSFPATITISPDGHYAALLNEGYGTQETMATQSIAVLDLKTNQITEFPDKRFGEEVHQSYFLGLVFSSDGKHLYASVGSISDPTGEKPGDTGNGIAVYSFADGKVAPERFIAIAPQPLAAGKKVAIGLRKTPAGTAIPYPAGLALVSVEGHDHLLIADNLSDNAVLLDVASGKVLQRFDLSTNDLVPSSFPYTCVATTRRPPRLVQPVECLAGGRAGFDEREADSVDHAEAAGRSAGSGFASDGDVLSPDEKSRFTWRCPTRWGRCACRRRSRWPDSLRFASLTSDAIRNIGEIIPSR